MKCDLCEAEMTLKRAEFFRYVESGLPNVFLSGIEVEECPNGHGQSPRIPRILALHEMIAEAVCVQPSPLTGAEARFLRKELGMKAKDWAAYLHVDVATLSRWENGEQTIGAISDVFLRTSFLLLRASRSGASLRDDLREKLTDIAQQQEERPAMIVAASKKKHAISFRPLRELA